MQAQAAFVENIESIHSPAESNFAAGWWTPRLAGPVIAAAVLRFTLLAISLVRFGANSLIYSDTPSYLEPGRNLLLHGRFFADGVPDIVRTPGYALFLAITSLAGLPAAAVANVILSVFSVMLVWRLGRVISDDYRVALGAAWIFAFEPVSLTYSAILLSDQLFLVLLLLSMERLAVFLRGHDLRVLAVSGLWLAAATFVRPVSYYLPFALALGLFLVLARIPDKRQRPVAVAPGLLWKAPAVLLIGVLPWLAAWQIRNWVETGYRGFSSAEEINLYFQNALGVTARVEQRPFLDVRKETGYVDFANNSGQIYIFPQYLAVHPEQAGWNQGQRLAFLRSQAIRIIREHYGVYLHTCLISVLRTVFIPGERSLDQLLFPDGSTVKTALTGEDQRRWTLIPSTLGHRVAIERAVFAIALLGVYLLAVWGAFRGGVGKAHLWMLLGMMLYFISVTAAGEEPGGNMRYRLPIMPIVCVLAAAGLRRTKILAR